MTVAQVALEQSWGARYQGEIGPEGEIRSVLAVALEGLPQAIGCTLWRADRQATLHNSDLHARVTYGTGQSGPIVFDCDWRGGFVVHGTKLLIESVSYKVYDPGDPYPYQSGSQIMLAASAGINGSRPSHAPTLTFLPRLCPWFGAGPGYSMTIPNLARRVSLLLRTGNDPRNGPTEDAPLSAIYLVFVDAESKALSWSDATPAALYGEGLTIPAGAQSVQLINNTFANTISVGAVFHLGL